MSKNLVYVGVVVLAVIAVVLGYKIYQQQTTLPDQSTPASPTPSVNKTPQSTAPQTQAQNIDLDALFKKFPGPNATVAEIQSFRDYLNNIGKETGQITIKNCKADPVVLTVRKGSNYTIKNEDDTDHKINILGSELTVKAKGVITLKVGEIGEYGYSCDNAKTGNIGIIHIVQ